MPATKAIGTETVSSGRWGMLCVSRNRRLVIVTPQNHVDYPIRQASGWIVYDRPEIISVELKRRCNAEFERKRVAGIRYGNDYFAVCDDMPKRFSEYVNTWFDSLVAEQLTDACRAEFSAVLSRVASRAALAELRNLADTLSAETSIPLVAHIDAINAGTFADEFRFTYAKTGAVSATGELFHLVRQAIYY